jgi:hypothetical protein
MPGSLIPTDLDRLIPPGADPLAWAREHLRTTQGYIEMNSQTGAMRGFPPRLVPAARADGSCHWLRSDGSCEVHANAPFGCAFYDDHQDQKTADRLAAYAKQKRFEEFRKAYAGEESLYKTLCAALWKERLVGGDNYQQANAVHQQLKQHRKLLLQFEASEKARREKKRKRRRKH